MHKTFDVKVGYVGYDEKERILFPTEEEADEYFQNEDEEDSQ